MSLSVGTRLGPYDIVAPLGAGGMGEVYRATDSRLKRQVAIKILPAALAADPDRLARFQREAEVLASLNHGRIAGIYGLEEADGAKALVMELVEGPTLADRIVEGPIPIREALPIASQIAEALEAAHGQGIIHRDLKPANIKVRDDGAVKVLDFGLAKLAEPPAASRAGQSDPSQSPTLAGLTAMTDAGMILGTAAYMSPEQARGRPVDKRTDVWAFGAVLYEMLTGRCAFGGAAGAGEAETTTDLIAAVLTSTPDWSALPANVPPPVVTLIQRCLDKDRHTRIGDMAVARFVLAGQAAPASTAAPAGPLASPAEARATPASTPLVAAAIVAAVLAGTAIGWWLSGGESEPPRPVTHLQMSVAPADHLVPSIASMRPSRTAMAISPDGRLVVFSAMRGGVTQLYVRALDRGEATPIAGTEGGIAPFLSPDGAWVAFWSGTTLKKVAIAGGPSATVADVPGPNWGRRGERTTRSTWRAGAACRACRPPVEPWHR